MQRLQVEILQRTFIVAQPAADLTLRIEEKLLGLLETYGMDLRTGNIDQELNSIPPPRSISRHQVSALRLRSGDSTPRVQVGEK